MTTMRRAVAGMELSTEFSVVRLESFSIRGASIVFGIFVTSGARLPIVLERWIQIFGGEDLPLDCQILDFAILVV